MSMEERILCYRRKVDGHDRWTSTYTIVVPTGDSHDYSPVLGTVDTGTISVISGPSARMGTKAGSIHSSADVEFHHAGESPRRRKIEWLLLGRSSKMEPRPVGFPVMGDAGDQPWEPETGNGKGGKWGESGRRTRPNININTLDLITIMNEDNSLDSQITRPVRNDRAEGVFNCSKFSPRGHVSLLTPYTLSLQV